jgi:hypothetical protein
MCKLFHPDPIPVAKKNLMGIPFLEEARTCLFFPQSQADKSPD